MKNRMQKDRQMTRYDRHRPTDDKDYLEGVAAATYAIRGGTRSNCPHHVDSGRFLRWTMGYQDEMYYVARYLFNLRGRKDLPESKNTYESRQLSLL